MADDPTENVRQAMLETLTDAAAAITRAIGLTGVLDSDGVEPADLVAAQYTYPAIPLVVTTVRDNQGVEWFRLDEEFRQYDAQQGGALWARPDKTGSVRESHLMVWRGPLIPVLDVKFLFEKPTGFKRVVAHRSRTAVSDGE